MRYFSVILGVGELFLRITENPPELLRGIHFIISGMITVTVKELPV